MEITTKHCCNLPTKKSKKHFKIGSWYKSNKQNITALYSGNPEVVCAVLEAVGVKSGRKTKQD